MQLLSMNWWRRGLLLGSICLAAALVLSAFIPIRMDRPFVLFYWPGLLLFHGPAMDPDWGLLFVLLRIAAGAGYFLVGFIIGALTKRIRLGAALCVGVFALAVGVPVFFTLLESPRRADESIRKGYWNRALETLKTNPDDVEAHSLLGAYSYLYYSQPERAIQEFKTVLELESANPSEYTLRALIQLAIVERQQGDAEQADEYWRRYREAMKTVPHNPGNDESYRRSEKQYLDMTRQGTLPVP